MSSKNIICFFFFNLCWDTIFLKVEAIDEDITEINSDIEYKITSVTPSSYENKFSVNGDNGEIRVLEDLSNVGDKASKIILTISASDKGFPKLSSNCVITITFTGRFFSRFFDFGKTVNLIIDKPLSIKKVYFVVF